MAPIFASSEVSEGLVNYYQQMRSNVQDSLLYRMGIANHPKDLKLL
jgi:hypothetical protein